MTNVAILSDFLFFKCHDLFLFLLTETWSDLKRNTRCTTRCLDAPTFLTEIKVYNY